MSPEAKRSDRVARLLQEELGQMLVEGLKDPRIGFATITEVRLSGDLRTARVYVSVYGTEEQRSETLAGLTAASGFLKRELSKRLRLKYTPVLTFVHDDTLAHADRLEQVFSAISAGETEVPEQATEPAVPVKTDRSELAERREEFNKPPEPETKRRPRGRGGKRRRR